LGCNPAACGGLKPFTVNAESVARFTSTGRDELLAQLRATLLPLLDYLRALPREEWDDGHGVANRLGQLVTVRGEIVPLTANCRLCRPPAGDRVMGRPALKVAT
jgi:hypothetical protein